MSDFTPLPDFRTGDLVSANKINTITDNIDYITGLEQARILAFDSGADQWDYATFRRAWGLPIYYGKQAYFWLAHNGDRLHLYYTTTGTAQADLWYDYGGANQQGPFRVAPGGDRTITINAAPFYRYQPVLIYIKQDPWGSDPTQNPALWVRYLYQTNSTLPSLSIASFVDGNTSAASDFNTVLRDCEAGLELFNQPVASSYYMADIDHWTASADPVVPGGTGDSDVGGLTAYIQHRHDTFFADMEIQGPGENSSLYDSAEWIYNGVTIWKIYLSVNGTGTGPSNPGSQYKSWSGEINVNLETAGLTLTPGNWYKIEFRYRRNGQGNDRGAHAALWNYGELANEQFSFVPDVTRWAHGDTVYGSIDKPNLTTLSIALDDLNSSARWYNPATRGAASYTYAVYPDIERVTQFWSFRIHRWLAYENFVLRDGKRANAQIQWSTGGRTLQSYTLPEATTPSFIDLETTPVKPGMYRRISGVKFAIQTPEPIEHYA